jgi:hypothetical protein
MRRLHLTFGLLGVLLFLLTGQFMRHHTPPMRAVSPDVHMMHVSRHIYLLGAALVNLALGLYVSPLTLLRTRTAQQIGSVLVLISPILLTIAFFQEPAHGLAGRSWRSSYALYALLAGSLLHVLSVFAEQAKEGLSSGGFDSSRGRP